VTSARGEGASGTEFPWPNGSASRCDRGPLGDVRETPRAHPRRPREREATPQAKTQTKSASLPSDLPLRGVPPRPPRAFDAPRVKRLFSLRRFLKNFSFSFANAATRPSTDDRSSFPGSHPLQMNARIREHTNTQTTRTHEHANTRTTRTTRTTVSRVARETRARVFPAVRRSVPRRRETRRV
jgi:hypothetical protein